MALLNLDVDSIIQSWLRGVHENNKILDNNGDNSGTTIEFEDVVFTIKSEDRNPNFKAGEE